MRRILSVIMMLSFFLSACTADAMPRSVYHSSPRDDTQDVQTVMERTAKVTVKFKAHVYGILEDPLKMTSKALDETVDAGWSGTGTVVDVNTGVGKGQSLLLTAAHVAHVPKTLDAGVEGIHIDIVSSEMHIQTYDGRTCKAEEMSADVESDVATIRVDCVAGTPAPIAKKLPPKGAKIYVAGCPLGYIERETVSFIEGHYVGVEDGFSNMVSVSVPGTHGFSGSAIYYNGEIFSVLVQGVDSYNYLTFGTSLGSIKRVIAEGEKKWQEVRDR